MTKLQNIAKDIKIMSRLYPKMDKRKVRANAYFYYSARWQALRNLYPKSLISAL